MKQLYATIIFIGLFFTTTAQPDRWQQRINYDMDVQLNVETNIVKGVERITYYNNSPDTLYKVFFHMFWNAFQPNSSMDVRSRQLGQTVLGMDKEGKEIRDWDKRVTDRIISLLPNEIGFINVASVKMNGKIQSQNLHETILEVVLDKPILPKSKASLEVNFEAQVPKQIRRSGRDNAEGIKFSMSQWYPKMVEYDYQGWHANPYMGREFYGVWGDYNVNITIDKKYMLAGTGTLKNGDQVGFGYSTPGLKVARPVGNTLTWQFGAENVHDFVWAADPEYIMIKRQIKDGPLIYVVHKNVDSTNNWWQLMADSVEMAYPIIAKTFGPYPYKNYSFIQAGDGGMEYPMATFIKGSGTGTAIHELMHSWYQMMMGSNENLYSWMDEGFTNFAADCVKDAIRNNKGFAQEGNYSSYYRLAKSGYEEPMMTPADFYSTNYAYSNASYGKGAVFVSQLGYIIGDKMRDDILLKYYWQWRFKHPNPNDFIRLAEKESGMELDWYKEFWTYTTKTINYAIDSLWEVNGKTNIRIKRLGEMPMPIDVQVKYKDGSKEMHYIPLNLMYGQKENEDTTMKRTVHDEWRWAHPTYVFETDRKIFDIAEVNIDPSQRLADVDKRNNVLKINW